MSDYSIGKKRTEGRLDRGLRRSTIAVPRGRAAFTGPLSAARLRTWVATPQAFVWAGVLSYAAFFSTLASLRYDRYLNRRFDLGNLTQAISATAEGRFFEATEIGGTQITRLGIHVDALLALLAPIWWVWPSPKALVITQVVVVALGALPVYWLARKHFGDTRAALVPPFLYLFYPSLQYNTMKELEATTLAVPLVLFAIWYLDEDRLGRFAVFALLAAASKEQMGLLVAGLGLWYVLRGGRPLVGWVIAAAGAAWTAVAFTVVIPHFSGGSSPFGARYESVGGSPTGILRTALTDPGTVLSAATQREDLAFLLHVGFPLACLCLLAPAMAVVAVPQLAVNLLSERPVDVSIWSQGSSPLVPIVFAAAIFGVARLGRHRNKALGVMVATTFIAIFSGPLAHIDGYGGTYPVPDRAHVAAADRATALIPDGAAVSATNNLGAHLSARRYFYSFPVLARAEWVVVDARDPRLPAKPSVRTASGGLSAGIWDLTIQPKRLHAEVSRMRTDPGWRLVFDEDDILVFRRVRA